MNTIIAYKACKLIATTAVKNYKLRGDKSPTIPSKLKYYHKAEAAMEIAKAIDELIKPLE